MNLLYRLIATGLFVGKIPVAPATFGSLWAVPLVLITGTSGPDYYITLAALLVIGVVAAGRVSEEVGEKDPREVVIDEIVALYLSFATFPLNWKILLAGFLLFRFYDIVKPFPARRLESMPGGWGIVADDMVAGAYTWATLKVAFLLLM